MEPARRRAGSTRRRCSPTCPPPPTIAQVEIFGPVLVLDDLPHAGRGGRAGQQHPLRARGESSGRRTSTWRSTSRRSSRPAWSGSTPPTCSTRRADSAATARAASAARAGARGCGSTCGRRWHESRGSRREREAPRGERQSSHARRRPARSAGLPRDRPHGQALHRRQAGAARLRLQPAGARRRRPRRSARWATATARTYATPSRRRTRRRRLGARHGAQPRADPVLHRREPRRAQRGVRARLGCMTGASDCARPRSRRDRAAVHVAAWADKYDGLVHHTPLRGT